VGLPDNGIVSGKEETKDMGSYPEQGGRTPAARQLLSSDAKFEKRKSGSGDCFRSLYPSILTTRRGRGEREKPWPKVVLNTNQGSIQSVAEKKETRSRRRTTGRNGSWDSQNAGRVVEEKETQQGKTWPQQGHTPNEFQWTRSETSCQSSKTFDDAYVAESVRNWAAGAKSTVVRGKGELLRKRGGGMKLKAAALSQVEQKTGIQIPGELPRPR